MNFSKVLNFGKVNFTCPDEVCKKPGKKIIVSRFVDPAKLIFK